jgi:hypothetical protein
MFELLITQIGENGSIYYSFATFSLKLQPTKR